MDSSAAIDSIRRRLAQEQVGAFAVVEPRNVAYVTGFDGVFDEEPAHIALIDATRQVLLTDARYLQAARAAAQGTAWEVQRVTDSLWASLGGLLGDIATVAIEDTLRHRAYLEACNSLGERAVIVRDWVETLRMVKSTAELRRIEAAAQLTDAAFSHILTRIAVGVTERELALDLEFFMRSNGSDGLAFPPIVASGPRSALPHATVTDRVIEAGEFLKMDFGARVDEYCSDMTRTVVVGRASARQKEIHALVLEANLAGIAAIHAGLPCSAADAAARAVIEAAGLGEAFSHGLGHGVGRDVHELPSVGARSSMPLVAGAVVTVEPGVYLEGFGGVRIEDLVVVEEHRARVLSSSTKELLEL